MTNKRGGDQAHPQAGEDAKTSSDEVTCRYWSTHAGRRTLPLVVMKIEPGSTRTRFVMLRPCDVEIAELTSRLTTAELVHRTLVEVAAFLEFDDGDPLHRALIGQRYGHASSPRDLLDGRFEVVGRVVTPIRAQEVLDAEDREQLAVGEEAGLPPKVSVAVVKQSLLGSFAGIRRDSAQ